MKNRTPLLPILLLITLLTIGWLEPAHGQIAGCKDPAANNYNAAATVNNGSCTYNTALYTPPVKVNPISNVLTETSGMQMAGNFLWSFNDGGGAAAIYRIDTASNAILQTVTLGGATNVDWEDIAFDGSYFYIGDFGNNANGARTNLKIYKFPLSAIPDHTIQSNVAIPSAQIDVINFTYSDQPQPPVATSSNHTKFDCEAMIVDGGRLHLFTKNWIDLTTTHYVIDGVGAGAYVATPVETLATNYLVTAADKAPGSDVVALLGYQTSLPGNHFLYLLSDYSGGAYFNGNKRRIDLPSAAEMGQAEGISFRNDGYGYISNEKFVRTVAGITLTVEQKLRSFSTGSFVPAYVLPIKLQQFSALKKNNGHEVTWRFTSPVAQLRIQQSSNGTDFITLQTFAASSNGSFVHQPTTGVNCYRLAWKETDGSERYSDVVCLKNKNGNSFSKVVLRSSGGELSFVFAGAPLNDCAFRLLTTDGKLVQAKHEALTAGTNRLSFSRNLTRGGVFVLEAFGEGERKSWLLKAE